MITPEFIGQIYRNTINGDVWRANSLTPGDWTKIAGAGGGGSNLDGAGDPTGVVTPDYVGQYYRDTSTGNVWKSTGATSVDWVLVVQDMGYRWESKIQKFNEQVGIYTNYSFDGITNFVFLGEHALGGFEYGYQNNLLTVLLPNLIDIDPSNSFDGYCDFFEEPALTSWSAPLLQTAKFIDLDKCPSLIIINLNSLANAMHIDVHGCISLPALTLPELVSLDGNFLNKLINADGCTSLASVNLSSFVPTNAKNLIFSGCALPLTQVDGLLAVCVANASYISGTVDISGGTNAAPTQGPGSAHDILVARGVTITHN